METEAARGMDKPQTLEPTSKLANKVNQRAIYKQLTLFDQGLTTLFVYPSSDRKEQATVKQYLSVKEM